MAKNIPKTHLLTEDEWRSIGVQQSKGWVHYMIHEPGKFLNRYLVIKFYFINLNLYLSFTYFQVLNLLFLVFKFVYQTI